MLGWRDGDGEREREGKGQACPADAEKPGFLSRFTTVRRLAAETGLLSLGIGLRKSLEELQGDTVEHQSSDDRTC